MNSLRWTTPIQNKTPEGESGDEAQAEPLRSLVRDTLVPSRTSTMISRGSATILKIIHADMCAHRRFIRKNRVGADSHLMSSPGATS